MANTVSAELALLESSGQKVDATTSGRKTRNFIFTDAVMAAAADTSDITTLLPPGSVILAVVVTDVTGAGTLTVGLSGGTADAVSAAMDPADVRQDVNNVPAGNNSVYLTAVAAAVTVSGRIEYAAGA